MGATVTAATWQEVRQPATQKLLCLYDPMRRLLWFRARGVDTIIDLDSLDIRERANEGLSVREGQSG